MDDEDDHYPSEMDQLGHQLGAILVQVQEMRKTLNLCLYALMFMAFLALSVSIQVFR